MFSVARAVAGVILGLVLRDWLKYFSVKDYQWDAEFQAVAQTISVAHRNETSHVRNRVRWAMKYLAEVD